MDPNKRRRPAEQPEGAVEGEGQASESAQGDKTNFGKETEEDREKDLADAEWKHLWDATEVIDMDKW